MIRRTASAEIAAEIASEGEEMALGRFLLRLPSGKAESGRKNKDMGPFLNSSSLSGLACIKDKHAYRLSRKAIKAS